jgi:hypothetical protein
MNTSLVVAVVSSVGSAPTPRPGVPVRPLLLDYFLMLAGASLSLVLVHSVPLEVTPRDTVPAEVHGLVALLPVSLRLGEGIVLLWPFFLTFQRLRGRKAGLTSGEWLIVLTWVGVATFFGLGLAARHGVSLGPYLGQARRFWYVVLIPTMAGLAVVFAILGLLRRTPAPWTHSFGLALVAWPVAPLAVILTLTRFAP